MLVAQDRSPVHDIVLALWGALRDLSSAATPAEVERWGFSIHAALSAAGREFHNHEHVIDLVEGADPIEVLAALYHDAVYIQVDHGPPRSMRSELTRGLAHEDDGYRILPAAGHGAAGDVLAVFGRAVGQLVTPTTGLNEFASALVAALQLEAALDRGQRIALAACIEQTVPFRVDPGAELHGRLVGLGLHGPALADTMRRAVRFGNRDVENFAETEPARFLDNTWKLLPESNPSLHSPLVYTVREYRVALQKMEGFLAWLPAERVFHVWDDEPRPELHARRIARATGNLLLAVRYLRAKLYSIAVVEAIAEVSGGDVPLDYFMGGLKSARRPEMRRIEQFLPTPTLRAELDPSLHRLLAEGRASESSFDTGPSPLAAFLHGSVGEAAMMAGVERARRWWKGELGAEAFLAGEPAVGVVAIARAATEIMDTRHAALVALAERLAAPSPR
jgi:hypothetical protein